MADDNLGIPRVPEVKPDDPEDVSWALSTAEAMWARGEHSDGIKWVRKAAEAASDAQADSRALELAKAASDLAGLIARQSGASPSAPQSVTAVMGPAVAPADSSAPAATPGSGSPVNSPSKRPLLVPAPPNSETRASSPPPPRPSPSGKPVPPPLPSSAPTEQRSAPRALVASSRPQGPAPGRGILSNRPPEKKRRRSRENLDAEAVEAEQIASANADASKPSKSDEAPSPSASSTRPRDPTVPGPVIPHALDAAEDGDRRTFVNAAPAPLKPTPTVHDPGIETTQAVRVVIWKDATGVHIAPAGTVVSAIKIDAVLVALEPSADLTAWLSRQS